jgi:regulatory protein YycI of two-component signal transduction system YycFG
MIGALTSFIPRYTSFINAHLPLWLNVISATVYLLITIGLLVIVFLILKNVQKIDAAEIEQDEEKEAKLDAIILTLGIRSEDVEAIKKTNKEKKIVEKESAIIAKETAK